MTDEELVCENVAKEFWAKHLSAEEYGAWLDARETDRRVYGDILSPPGGVDVLKSMSDERLKKLAKLVNDEVWRRVK